MYPKDRELHKHHSPSRGTKSFDRGLEFVVVLRRLNMLRDGSEFTAKDETWGSGMNKKRFKGRPVVACLQDPGSKDGLQ